MTLTCQICKKPYQYRITSGKRDTKAFCHNCVISRHHYALRVACAEYKGGSCQLCGYNKIRGLTFHHVDPSSKLFGVAQMTTCSIKRIKDELDKCVLLCSNCHAEVHGDIELLRLGLPVSDLLLRIKVLHQAFVPSKAFSFTRHDWNKHHPLFVDKNQSCA